MNKKRSLWLSVLSIFVCLTLLVGSTFAWFTDKVSSTGNTIKSGTLEIKVTDKDGNDLEALEEGFITADNVEPGWSSKAALRVENVGSLATDVKFIFTLAEGDNELLPAMWYSLDNGTTKLPMAEITEISSQKIQLVPQSEATDENGLKYGENFAFTYGMYEEAGNKYQDKSFSMNLSIEAIQSVYEYDGFGYNTYDENAEYGEEISTAEELLALAAKINDGDPEAATGKYVLTNDIDLTDMEWAPIGNGTYNSTTSYDGIAFKGVFDGNGKTISGITYENNVKGTGASVFGIVDGATIANLKVANSTFTNTADAAAGIVAVVHGTGTTTIENCEVADTVINGNSVGGVAARLYGPGVTNISNCVNNSTVNGSSKAGGIVCIISNPTAKATVSGCTNNGAVDGGSGNIGGIVAHIGAVDTVTVSNCENTANLGDTEGNVGGIIGYASGNDSATSIKKISNCSNSGNITANNNAGGIIGIITQFGYTVVDSNNSGAITSGNAAGGIVGSAQNGAMIETSSNTGAVSGTKSAGGVVGDSQSNSTVKYCSGGTAEVTSGTVAGRLIGHVYTGPSNAVYVYVKDGNGDNYTGYNTLGGMAMWTSHGWLHIEDGTFYGMPDRTGTQAPAHLVFAEGTTWVKDGGTTIDHTVETQYDSQTTNPDTWNVK